MKITQDIQKGKLHSAYAVGAFDKAKEALESKGYRVISLEEQAGLRIQEGANSEVSQRGNWTREGVIYVPTKGTFLTKNSPVMDNAFEATNANRKGNWFNLDDSQVESALADSVKLEAGEVPTNRLAEDERTAFAFGKNAKAYREFLKENGVNSVPIYLANTESKPFAAQMWFRSIRLVHRSSLYGGDWDLDGGNDRLRGVREPGIEQE